MRRRFGPDGGGELTCDLLVQSLLDQRYVRRVENPTVKKERPVDYELSEQGLPILDQFSEGGLVDCFFEIVERVESAEHFELQLRASHDGNPVGLKVWVRRGIQGVLGADKKPIAEHVYRQAVRFSRTGPESDRLIAAVAALYELPAPPTRMVETIAFTAIALHRAGQVDMEKEPIKLELFGHDGPEEPAERYFESFLELDLTNGFAYWTEKNPACRVPLLKALAAPDAG